MSANGIRSAADGGVKLRMNWKLIGCALEGRRHTAIGIPCQDKVRVAESDGVWVGVLADGAGSASCSHHGAQCVADTVCDILPAAFDLLYSMPDAAKAKNFILLELLDALRTTAEGLAVPLKELASTLLFVAIKDHRMILGHIGDGVICYQNDAGLHVASKPTNGEFANSTVFVTSSGALHSMKLIKGELGNISGFCLMSDGTAASLYDRMHHRPMPVLSKLLRLRTAMATAPLQKMLEDSFRESVVMNTQDDCSIVLMSVGANLNAGDVLADFVALSEKPAQRAHQLARYKQVLALTVRPASLQTLSIAMHIKPKHVKKYVSPLLQLGLLTAVGPVYLAVRDD